VLKRSGGLDILLLLFSLKWEGLPTVANVDRTGVRGEAKNNEKSITHQCTFKKYICINDLKIHEEVQEGFAA